MQMRQSRRNHLWSGGSLFNRRSSLVKRLPKSHRYLELGPKRAIGVQKLTRDWRRKSVSVVIRDARERCGHFFQGICRLGVRLCATGHERPCDCTTAHAYEWREAYEQKR